MAERALFVEQAKPIGFHRARAVCDSHLQDVLEDLADSRARARTDFGVVVHDQVVNIPLADLYRELDEAERAVRNARNALKAMREPEPARTGARR